MTKQLQKSQIRNKMSKKILKMFEKQKPTNYKHNTNSRNELQKSANYKERYTTENDYRTIILTRN